MKKNRKNRMKDSKISYVLLIILLIVVFFIADYIITEIKKKEQMLSSKTIKKEFTVSGRWRNKLMGNIFTYSYKGKLYKSYTQNYKILKNGEKYLGKISIIDPKVSEVDLTKPIVSSSNKYFIVYGKIKKRNTTSNPNSVTFTYQFDINKYERTVFVEDASKYFLESNYNILVLKENPNITYIENNVVKLNY